MQFSKIFPEMHPNYFFRPLSVGGGFMRVNGNPMENNVGHNHNHVQAPPTPLPQVNHVCASVTD